MLKKLFIKNFALIDEITVEFHSGLNIITGETGAGKSIVINAINLLLGEKAKPDLIRQGFDNAVVEGEFIVHPKIRTASVWQDIDVDDSDYVIIRRELYRQGRARTFINDSPANNTILTEIGDTLVDLHGQHEHQALFKSDYHLTCLDNYGVSSVLLEQVTQAYKAFKTLQKQKKETQEKYQLLKEKKDLLDFQVREISDVNPQAGEDSILAQEEKILQNSEKLIQTTQLLQQLLYDNENSVYENLTTSLHQLGSISQIDSYFSEFVKSGENARLLVEDIAKGCQSYLDRIDFDPERLESIRERLSQLNRLKKKYGAELDDVIVFYEQTMQDLNHIENMDHNLDQINNQFNKACNELFQLCAQLTVERQNTAQDLEKHIKTLLSDLGMANNQFKVDLKKAETENSPICQDGVCYNVSPRGWDKAEFLISLNLGESLKQLKEVASGGEISRIMLALKHVLADADAIPVLVFDEIDSGISGRIARIVGQNLKDLARKHQIICITHLPQIASLGDHHLVVQKIVHENRSITTMRCLETEERIHEIAKLLGGETITQTTLETAKELIQVDL